MTTNDITGDRLRSRPNNKAFEDNFDRIFGVKDDKPNQGDDSKDRELHSEDGRSECKADSR